MADDQAAQAAAYEDPDGDGPDVRRLARTDYELGLVEWLKSDYRVIAAAHIGDTFGIDPITVLTEPDRLKRLVRLAAALIVQDERNRARKAEDEAIARRMRR